MPLLALRGGGRGRLETAMHVHYADESYTVCLGLVPTSDIMIIIIVIIRVVMSLMS